jgi:CheY-like chemotaxis protein
LPLLLHIDSNPADARLLADALAEAGVGACVMLATNAVEAFSLLMHRTAADACRPSVIVLEMKLPAIDGRTILKTLKNDARWKDLPVVVFSSSLDGRDTCLALGALDYVVKPARYAGYVDFARSLATHLRPTARQ